MAKRKTTKPGVKSPKKTTAAAVEAPSTAPVAVASEVPTIALDHVVQVPADLSYDSEAAADRARKACAALYEKASKRSTNPRPVSMTTAASIRREWLALPHFLPQWLVDSYGYPKSGLVMIVGDTQSGKSTRVLCDMAHIMKNYHAPALYLSCEGVDKTMLPERMLRCMDSNPERAYKLLQTLYVEYASSVVELQHRMRTWAEVQREGNADIDPVPMNIPLLIAIDPFSRLMSAVEAEGHIIWDKVGAETPHDLGTGSNMNHAKFAAEMTRWLKTFCDRYQVLVFIVHHRTSDVDFNQAKSRAMQNMSDHNKRLKSFKYLGGSAFEGLASMTIVMTSTDLVKDRQTDTISGRRVYARCYKQSHGASERYVSWELRMNHDQTDRDDFLEPPIQYSHGLVTMLKNEGYLGVTINDAGLVSSKELNLRCLTPAQFDAWLHSKPDIIKDLGNRMKIIGYYSIMDKVVASMQKAREALEENAKA
jgi:AAA domain